ncbi:MAG TPA: DUF4191 domain-containing protein [Catenuloplanes sp.]|jgi:hypothetical protein
MAKPPEKLSFGQKLKQIGTAFSFTAKQDKWFAPLAAAAVLIPVALTVLAVILWGWIYLPVGIMLALLALLFTFTRRFERAQLAAIERQPGAAASIIQGMRGDWRVRPAVASTTNDPPDMVHLVIGRPGVILLAEGNPQRVRGLVGPEKRRLAKVVGNAPIYDYLVGPEEGQLPLGKLRVTLMKLPRNLTGKDVNALDTRLQALLARPQMPKGAIPKNMRPSKGAFRQSRGR